MEKVSCSCCGSNELTRDGSYYVCSYCGTRFKTNSIDSTIAINNDVARLLQKCKDEPQNAREGGRINGKHINIPLCNHAILGRQVHTQGW